MDSNYEKEKQINYPFFRSGHSEFLRQHTKATTTAIPVIKITAQPTIIYIRIPENPRPSV